MAIKSKRAELKHEIYQLLIYIVLPFIHTLTLLIILICPTINTTSLLSDHKSIKTVFSLLGLIEFLDVF